MDIRYSANQRDFKRYTTEETRNEFLIENLYVANEVVAVYSHVDRMVTLGCMPTTESVSIDKGIDVWANFGTSYFLERREIGIFNIGGAGTITRASITPEQQQAYRAAFDRFGLRYRAVAADSGAIGGDLSEEFQAVRERGLAQAIQRNKDGKTA